MSTYSPSGPSSSPVPELNGRFLTGYGASLVFGRRPWERVAGLQIASITEVKPQAVMRESSLLPFHFLRTGDRLGRLVVKIRRGDGGCGTGFLVAPDVLMTNHHVLPSATVAAEAVAVADFESAPTIGGARIHPIEVPLKPDRLFFTWGELDFTFCGVEGLQDRGAIEMDRSEPPVGPWDVVNIIQHPRGRPKEVALRDNQVIKADSVVLHYVCDTEPGSSGSPVFDNRWKLVAIHHASIVAERPTLRPLRGHDADPQFLNEGIRIVALALWIESNAAEVLVRAEGGDLKSLERVRSLFRGSDPKAGLFGALGRSLNGRSAAEFVADPGKLEGEVLDVAYWDLQALKRAPLDSVSELGPIIQAMGMDIWLLANISTARAQALAEHLQTSSHRAYAILGTAHGAVVALVRESRAIAVEKSVVESSMTVRVRLRDDPASHQATIRLMTHPGNVKSARERIARLKPSGSDCLVLGPGAGDGVWAASGVNGGVVLVRSESSIVARMFVSPNLEPRQALIGMSRGSELIEAAIQVAGRAPIAARLVLKTGSGVGI